MVYSVVVCLLGRKQFYNKGCTAFSIRLYTTNDHISTLFEGRFRSSLVQAQDYLLTCLHYIELNPVRAGLVKDPGDYRWSSYTAHGFGRDIAMWTPHSLYLSLGNDGISRQKKYRELMRENLNAEVIAKIRHCVNTGLVLGTEKFRSQVQKLTGDARKPLIKRIFSSGRGRRDKEEAHGGNLLTCCKLTNF